MVKIKHIIILNLSPRINNNLVTTNQSGLQDDEYVVYSPDQVKLKYVVQFSISGDQLQEFRPSINTSDEPSLPSCDQGEHFISAKYTFKVQFSGPLHLSM